MFNTKCVVRFMLRVYTAHAHFFNSEFGSILLQGLYIIHSAPFFMLKSVLLIKLRHVLPFSPIPLAKLDLNTVHRWSIECQKVQAPPPLARPPSPSPCFLPPLNFSPPENHSLLLITEKTLEFGSMQTFCHFT